MQAWLLFVVRTGNWLWYRYLSARWEFCTREYFTDWIGKCAGQCGADVRVNGRIIVTDPSCLTIGNNVHIGAGCFFRTEGGLVIGDHAHISRNVVVYTDSHNYAGAALPYDATTRKAPVVIGRNAWIGMNVNIRPGVRIGEGSIIGIGATVTRDVDPFEIIGAPHPNHIGNRDRDAYHTLDQECAYGGVSGMRWTASTTHTLRRSIGDGENVVFVCSTGRSGSKAIARILNTHPQICARHEPHANLIRLSTELAHGKKTMEQAEWELLGLYHHASTIPTHQPVYMESDQKLGNLIPILHRLFPAARFVWLLRNGKDVVASTYARSWFSNQEYNPTEQGEFGKLRVYSEFRLRGDLVDPTISTEQWGEMSAFERNCWYWAFWNSTIERDISSLPSSEDRFVLRIEDFDRASSELLRWLNVADFRLTSSVHNRARAYSPYPEGEWTDEERRIFDRWCSRMMKAYYPETAPQGPGPTGVADTP